MASVSTNKLGSLAEQSVEEPTSGAPKLEAMVEVKFKVRQLAVLLKAEESVSPMPVASASKTTKTTVTTTTTATITNNGKFESSSYGLAATIKATSTSAGTIHTAVRSTAGVISVQNLHHEARQIKVEKNVKSFTFELGQKTERDCLQNQAVQSSKRAVNEVNLQINNENLEFPVHDWGVPENFIVDLPESLKFDQHLCEARRLENALVLVKKPTKLLAFQQIQRERILIDVMDATKLRSTNLKKNSIKIDFFKKEEEISNSTSNTKAKCNNDNFFQEISSSPTIVQEAFQGITITELPDEQNSCEQIEGVEASSERAVSDSNSNLATPAASHDKRCYDFKLKAPDKFRETLTAALDLALLAPTKFQLKWKRSDDMRKSAAFKCYAKAQVNFTAKKWPLPESIIETRVQKSFTKWETSESLQLLKSKKKVTSKFLNDENLAQAQFHTKSTECRTTETNEQIKVFKENLVESRQVEQLGPSGEVRHGAINIMKVNDYGEDDPTNDDDIPMVKAESILPQAELDARERISTFFDLKILEDNLSPSEESDTDYLSETKSSPEALSTVSAAANVVKVTQNFLTDKPMGDDDRVRTENIFKAQQQHAGNIGPVIANDRFLVKLLDNLSATGNDLNEQEVELLYIRKTPFIEEDDEQYGVLEMSEKPMTVAGTNATKYLMGLLEKKTSSEDDLIEIDAESDDWDEELDPEIDRIEFFDSDEQDYVLGGDGMKLKAESFMRASNANNNIECDGALAVLQLDEMADDVCACDSTKVLFGNIDEPELLEENKLIEVSCCRKDQVYENNKELPLLNLPRFRVVPNTPKAEPAQMFSAFVHDDERPSCSKFRSESENFGQTTWYPIKYKKIPAMTFENENVNYQSELQSVLKKIRLLSEIDELDQCCVYEESDDTEQRLYMKNGEWFATEPSESDEESRNEKRTTLEKELQSMSDTDSPRTFFNESFAAKRYWMLSELRKRFGLRMAKYDPTKKRPGMIIDSENWEEAYSESTFWNSHKNSFEKVRVLARKGRFKFAIISEAKRNRKAETSDEGEQSDKSSSDDEKDNNKADGKALIRKHSSFEIRQANCKRNDDGEIFFQPINGRSDKCNERRWALPPSRIYRFSRSFGRFLKLHMKRPDLETILEERESNVDLNEEDCFVGVEEEEAEQQEVELSKVISEAASSKVHIVDHIVDDDGVDGEVDSDNIADVGEDDDDDDGLNGASATKEQLDFVIINFRKKSENTICDKSVERQPQQHQQQQPHTAIIAATATTTALNNDHGDARGAEVFVDWYYCFYNDHNDDPLDEDYFGDISDFE